MRRSIRARLYLLLVPLAMLFTAGAWLVHHNFGSALTGPLVAGCSERLPPAVCNLQAALLPWLVLGLGVVLLLWLAAAIFLLVLQAAIAQLQENVLDFRKGHLEQLGDNLPAEMYFLVQQLDRILRASRNHDGQASVRSRSPANSQAQRPAPPLDRPDDPVFLEPETEPRPRPEPPRFAEPEPKPRPRAAPEPAPYTEPPPEPRPRTVAEPSTRNEPPVYQDPVYDEPAPYAEPPPEPRPRTASEPPAARTQSHPGAVHPFVTRGREDERRSARPEPPEPTPARTRPAAPEGRPSLDMARPMATRERPPRPEPAPAETSEPSETEPPVYMDPEPPPESRPEPKPRAPDPTAERARETAPAHSGKSAQRPESPAHDKVKDDRGSASTNTSYPALQCRKITTMLGSRYPHVNFELISDVSDHRSWPVAEGELKELFGQLLDNAGKWGRSQINVFLAIRANMLVFGVADDGPGVPPELVPSLGTEGFQANRESPGKGVGLSNVRKVVDRHGGSLTFDTSRLGGLEVVATLPQAMEDEETQSAAHF